MQKPPEMHAAKFLSAPKNIALLSLALILMAFIAYKAWQEYLIYQINEAVQQFPTAAGTVSERVITWADDANNEQGYQIERRSKESSEYENIAIVEANATSYVDSTILSNGEYCYRVVAFNQAGQARSDDSCIDIYQPEPYPDESLTTSIVSEFTGRTGVVELNGREFYSFKSNTPYNQEFSIDEVSDLDFSITKGRLIFKDSRAFVFKEQGVLVDRGFARMKLNDLNSFSFSLQGNEQEQVATLYLSLGVWGEDMGEAGLLIDTGDTSHRITIPSRDMWHFMAINITFDQYTYVTVTPIGRHKRKSSVRVAGVVLNNGDNLK